MSTPNARESSASMLRHNRELEKRRISNETFYVAECELGYGMFASREISKGEVIFVFGGGIIDFNETKKRGEWECMPIQIDHDRYIDTLQPGVFVNHSCSPNCGVYKDYSLITLRTIKKDEELRFDYSTTMEEDSFQMLCRCGSERCRQIVADFSTLPTEIQREYIALEIVMSFILRNRYRRNCGAREESFHQFRH